MSDSVHLLIPFAASAAEGCVQAMRTLELPQLEKLLARLTHLRTDNGDDSALAMPHERVLARECGLPGGDGHVPWAAWQVRQAGHDPGDAAWARITPCHWRVATDHVLMSHPQDLHLDAEDSQSLLAAMLPYFEQDGITLEYEAPTLWLAQGEPFRDLAAASLDRVVGQRIDPWMPREAEARAVRRLQQEMQMLLYTHEVNEERVRGGLLPVNSFWVSGAGALPPGRSFAPPPELQITHYLRDAALLEDWRGWVAAWHQVDSKECARLVEAVNAGGAVTLTLCGERNSQTWSSAWGGGLLRRLGGWIAGKQAAALLETL